MPIHTWYDASADAFRERIQASGEWPLFSYMKKFFSEQLGMTTAAAWQRAHDVFPAEGWKLVPKRVDMEEDDADGFSVEEAAESIKSGRSLAGMVAEDVQWIYTHLGIRKPSKADCPSPGAWAWHRAIVVNEDGVLLNMFLRDILPKFLPPAKALEAAQRFEDDGSAVIDTIEKCLGAAKEMGSAN